MKDGARNDAHLLVTIFVIGRFTFFQIDRSTRLIFRT